MEDFYGPQIIELSRIYNELTSRTDFQDTTIRDMVHHLNDKALFSTVLAKICAEQVLETEGEQLRRYREQADLYNRYLSFRRMPENTLVAMVRASFAMCVTALSGPQLFGELAMANLKDIIHGYLDKTRKGYLRDTILYGLTSAIQESAA